MTDGCEAVMTAWIWLIKSPFILLFDTSPCSATDLKFLFKICLSLKIDFIEVELNPRSLCWMRMMLEESLQESNGC